MTNNTFGYITTMYLKGLNFNYADHPSAATNDDLIGQHTHDDHHWITAKTLFAQCVIIINSSPYVIILCI